MGRRGERGPFLFSIRVIKARRARNALFEPFIPVVVCQVCRKLIARRSTVSLISATDQMTINKALAVIKRLTGEAGRVCKVHQING